MLLSKDSSISFQETIKKYPQLNQVADPIWRINNLYWIKDKKAKRIRFQPNWAQQELLNDTHPCQIVLKARQLGITTYYCIKALDDVLFKPNFNAGIIAHTLNDAKSIFVDKLKFAFDNLHPAIRALFKTLGDSTQEIRFSHGSAIRVGTSLRSSTLQHLHITEHGKICAQTPEKAREVKTGALSTVHPGQKIIIESTAEGKLGDFYDFCQRAEQQKINKTPLGLMDFSFHFFPWWKEPSYILQGLTPTPSAKIKVTLSNL